MLRKMVFYLVILQFLGIPLACAIPTHVLVRVKAKDAKFIGTSMGGALVTIKDAYTGELLTKGFTSGGTGDTHLIMKTPKTRGMTIGKGAARFDGIIDIDEPKLIEISVKAPYAQRQAMQEMTLTTWVIPGRDIAGDGIVFEMPGFVVDVLSPPAHTMKKVSGNKIRLVASVSPMCGCPVNPNTFWHPESIEVGAFVKRNGKFIDEIPLKFSGKTNIFVADLLLKEPGAYTISVFAFDKKSGNTGVDMTTIVIH